MALVKYHELEAITDGLAYFTPEKGADPLGDAIRKRGGSRAEDELRLQRLRIGEAVVRRGYGTKCTYLVVTAAPVYDPVRKEGVDAYAMAIRACLDAGEKYSLTSLTFGSWSLSSASLPAVIAALTTYRVLDEWRASHPRRTLKKIVLALHDHTGHEAFKLVNNLGTEARSALLMADASGEDSVWKVEKVHV